MTLPIRNHLLPFMLIAALAAGCSKEGDKKVSTQVAARVNSTEITVSQINRALAGAPNIAPEAAERAKRGILDKLIDQELTRQQAMDNKLDRLPGVVMAIEAAKTEILARAYIEKFASTLPKATPDEVKKYYAEHPALFSERRIFNVEEITVEPKEGIATALAEQVAKSQSMNDIGNWLKAREIKFSASRGIRTAEQIPLETLPRLQSMKDGDTKVFHSTGGPYEVIRVVASKTAPVDEAKAEPRIKQFLFNRRSSEAIATEIKRLKAGAKIKYEGEFAEGAAAEEKRAKVIADAKAKALSETKAKEDTEAKARAEEIAKTRREAEAKARLDAEAKARTAPTKGAAIPNKALEKGIEGLK